MKIKDRMSKKTMALLAAAVMLLAGSGIMGTKASLNTFSEYDNTVIGVMFVPSIFRITQEAQQLLIPGKVLRGDALKCIA